MAMVSMVCGSAQPWQSDRQRAMQREKQRGREVFWRYEQRENQAEKASHEETMVVSCAPQRA
jgi:post-segregation antitoxin (ccd killing protein)